MVGGAPGDTGADAMFQLNSGARGGVATSRAARTPEADLMPGATAALVDERKTLYLDCAFVNSTGKRRTFQTGTVIVYRRATING